MLSQQVRELTMRSMFWLQALRASAQADRFNQAGEHVGLETEARVYNPDLSIDELGDACASIKQTMGTASELGLLQLEVSRPPVRVNGSFASLVKQHRLVATSLELAAREHNVRLVRCGTDPFWPTTNVKRTKTEKYRQVPDFNQRNQRPDLVRTFTRNGNLIDLSCATIVALCSAFQVNREAKSLEHAIKLLNYSFMLSPYLLALAGNARYLNGQDTGWADIRTHAWELSHDTRTPRQLVKQYAPRVGLPEAYIHSFRDYASRIQRYPFILFHPTIALNVGIGMAWWDARLKLIGDSAVVELRSLPTQPHWEDEIALTAAYLGMLHYAECRNLPFIPIEQVAQNRSAAMQHGMKADLWLEGEKVSAIKAAEVWLRRAEDGLRCRGLADAVPWLKRLHRRLDRGCPSEQLAYLLDDARPTQKELMQAMHECHMLV